MAEFALSFDAYSAFGGFEPCAELANAALERFQRSGELPSSLVELRTCLFFEQRRQHHGGPEKVNPYMRALIEAIRSLAPSPTSGDE